MIGNAPDFLDPDRPDTVRLEVADATALGERALGRIGFPAEEARIVTDQLIDNSIWVGRIIECTCRRSANRACDPSARASSAISAQSSASARITDIKPRDIAPLVDKMLDTPTEMRNAFVYLRGFLTWAYKRGYTESIPTARMEAPRKPESRSRVLTRDELAAIWRACPETDYGAIVKLCILSGQRLGQWAAVRREYVSGDTITWPDAVMKAGRPMTLPLTPAMHGLLPDRIGLLFPNDNGQPYSNWTKNKRRLDRASGIVTYVHHDFRRSLATTCAEELDIEPHIVEAILAHANGSAVSRVYNRATHFPKIRKALESYEQWLFGSE